MSNLLRELGPLFQITLVAPLGMGSVTDLEALGLHHVVPVASFAHWEGRVSDTRRRAVCKTIVDLLDRRTPQSALVWAGAEFVVMNTPGFPPTVFDNLDCGAVIAWREACYGSRLRDRLRAVRDSIAVAVAERRIVRLCRSTVVNAEADARVLRRLSGRRSVHVVPNGIILQARATPSEEAPDPTLVFTGTMDFPPNVEAARWFVREVWPRVRRAIPSAQFVVVGRNPTPEVSALKSVPGVLVQGEVPDVSILIRRAWLAVAPMQTGGGLRNKVLDAWAVGRPVVLSQVAASGLQLDAEGQSLVARDARQAATVILRLLADGDARLRLGIAAHALAGRAYQWPVAAARLAELLGGQHQG